MHHLPQPAAPLTHGLWSGAGYPRFQRDPFARDVALDPGGTTMPRMAALHMLHSTMKTVSAPASSSFRGSLPHPTQQLCTLRNHCRQWPRNTRYQADATPYLDRTSTGWIAPALPGALIRSPRRHGQKLGGTSKPSALAVLMLSTVSYFVGACTGRLAGFSPFRMRSRRRRRQADTTRPDQSRRRSIRLR